MEIQIKRTTWQFGDHIAATIPIAMAKATYGSFSNQPRSYFHPRFNILVAYF
jgi:hypothetical protein